MSEKTEKLIRDYWEVCVRGDFKELTPYYSDDAVVMDPAYGTFTGYDAISAFMVQATDDTKEAGSTFALEEVAADGTCAWARWNMVTAGEVTTAVSIYRIRDGLITFEQILVVPPPAN